MHAGVAPDAATGGILTPIHQSTTFVQESIDAYMAKGYSYSRTTNPTVAVLEAKVAELEGAAGSCCFATGMAATATAGAREPRAAAPSSARRRGGARAARPGPRGRAAAGGGSAVLLPLSCRARVATHHRRLRGERGPPLRRHRDATAGGVRPARAVAGPAGRLPLLMLRLGLGLR